MDPKPWVSSQQVQDCYGIWNALPSSLSPAENFVVENLLQVKEEKEALEIIQSSSLSPKEKVEAILEWRRIQ